MSSSPLVVKDASARHSAAPATPLGGAAAPPGGASAAQKRAPGQPRLIAYVYIAPAFAVFATFVLFPLVRTGWISLHDWDGLTPMKWVGFANYQDALTDERIRAEFINTLQLCIFYSLLPVTMGVVVAVLLTRQKIRGLTFFRAVFFLPLIMATAVVGVTWRWMYEPDGPINQILTLIGLGGATRPWLGDFTFALPALGLVGTWTYFGFVTMACVAGVQRIPAELYEAARVDGAGWVSELRTVTLPGLRNQVVVVLVLTTVAALRTFDLVFVTTRGGPGQTTRTPAVDVYERAFLQGKIGSAAAIAMCLAVFVFVVTFLLTRVGERRGA